MYHRRFYIILITFLPHSTIYIFLIHAFAKSNQHSHSFTTPYPSELIVSTPAVPIPCAPPAYTFNSVGILCCLYAVANINEFSTGTVSSSKQCHIKVCGVSLFTYFSMDIL